ARQAAPLHLEQAGLLRFRSPKCMRNRLLIGVRKAGLAAAHFKQSFNQLPVWAFPFPSRKELSLRELTVPHATDSVRDFLNSIRKRSRHPLQKDRCDVARETQKGKDGVPRPRLSGSEEQLRDIIFVQPGNDGRNGNAGWD